ALGKEEQGLINVKFQVVESDLAPKQIKIIISDDGAGINPLNILTRMKKLGYPKEDLEKTDEEVLQTIFDDKFSSRDEVSEISGRGVGLGAVK
ncbi:hypothetical protein ACEWAS_22840, partial [Vibrio parahaemolyticus]